MNPIHWFKWFTSLFCSNGSTAPNLPVLDIPMHTPAPSEEPVKKPRGRDTASIRQIQKESDVLWEQAHSDVKSIGRMFKSIGDIELKNGKKDEVC